MNPSGTSNRTLFDGHIEPMRQPHMSLMDAAQALHLGSANPGLLHGGPRLSADAHEFVPFTTNPSQFYVQQQQQQQIFANNYQGSHHQQQRYAGAGGGQPQPYSSHRQNLQQQQQTYASAGQPQYHQQQRLPSSVQSRLHNNAATTNGSHNAGLIDGGGGYHNPYQQSQQQPQQFGGRYNSNHHHQQQSQAQHNHNRHRNGGMGPTRSQNQTTVVDQSAAALDDGVQTQEEVQALDMLRETIQQLQDKPGMFEEYAMDLKEAFGDVIESRLVMSCAIEMLFEQSVMEPQCRYMGARLCHLLDSLATTSVTSVNLFRELLILKLAHDETELPLSMVNEQLKVRGTALFLADLYVQLNSDSDQRIIELARSILSTMELLLSKPGPENAKCVCQSLKLCGYQLEQDVGPDIENLMAILAKLEHELDTSTSRLIESVLKLRASRWGRNTMAAKSSSSAYKPYAQQQPDGPVFYGPDGQVLTDDEASFLNANSISSAFLNGGGLAGLTLNSLGAGDGMGGFVGGDDFSADMDPVVQEAYRQFLRSNH